MLHFIALCRCCIFYKSKVSGNPALSVSIGIIFPIAFAHFVYVLHFGNSCSTSNFYCYICHGDLWSAIFDVTTVIVFGCHELFPCKMANLTAEMTAKDLEDHTNLVEKAAAGFQRIDSNFERSPTASKIQLNSITCYRVIIHERRRSSWKQKSINAAHLTVVLSVL